MNLPVDYMAISQFERRKVREYYSKIQDGKCYYCDKPLDKLPNKDKPINVALFPKGFFNYPVHLHHNHRTHMTIGAVHCYCNAVLWEYCGE